MKWDEIVPKAEEIARTLKQRVGVAPTLRGLFYALVSTEILPNTKSAYQSLSRALARARKNGEFSWSLLIDETRVSVGGETSGSQTLKSIESDAETITQDYIRDILFDLNAVFNADVDFTPRKWEGQTNRVVFCLEKEALKNAVLALTREWHVEVNVLRGYCSVTHLKKLADKIRRISRTADPVVILLTDFDPSGEDIVRNVRENLLVDFGVQCTVLKAAVTLDQINEFNLPSQVEDSADREKMERDPRFKNWRHGHFRVELDALLSIVPEEFKEILTGAISEYFHVESENSVKAQADKFTEEAKERLDKLAEKIPVEFKATLEQLLEEVTRHD